MGKLILLILAAVAVYFWLKSRRSATSLLDSWPPERAGGTEAANDGTGKPGKTGTSE